MEEKILIVNVNWVGDVLFSTPFIRAVRQAHPSSYIACLLHPRCKEVLEGNPRINEIIVYDEEGIHRSLIGKLMLIWTLRKKGFDTAFILHRSFTKAMIAYFSGARKRIGYATKNRGIFLTDAAEEPAEPPHKVEYFLNIAGAAGIAAEDRTYEFFIGENDREYARKFLNDSGIGDGGAFAAINPGGNWGPKRWPAENFAHLSDRLVSDYGLKVIITGAQKDIALAEDIKAAMKNVPIIACGKTTLKQAGAIFERARLVVANDTGPMHMACAIGAPVIGLFGPTSPKLTGPSGKGRYKVIHKTEGCEAPCYDLDCADYKCMNAITVEDVVNEVKVML